MGKYVAESERLWLQPLSVDEHLEDYHIIASNPVAMKWSIRTPATNLQETRQMMEARIPTTERPWVENYAILLRSSATNGDNPKLIGIMGTPRNEPAGAEIGYGLHPDYWGKGYATEALRLFLGVYWGVGRDASREVIIAEIDPKNTASKRVVEKVGFQRGELLEDINLQVSDVKAGETQTRSHVRWYLYRPMEGVWKNRQITDGAA